jgi:hypothetical protein
VDSRANLEMVRNELFLEPAKIGGLFRVAAFDPNAWCDQSRADLLEILQVGYLLYCFKSPCRVTYHRS